MDRLLCPKLKRNMLYSNKNHALPSTYSLARLALGREEILIDRRLPLWRWVWTADAIPKVKCFIW